MRIGEVAQLTGVSARSIRNYHRLGVLAEPERTPGGYRSYTVADLARIAHIGFLSSSGVPLRDVGAILDADRHRRRGDSESFTGTDVSDAMADLGGVRAGIDQRIADLMQQRRRLDLIAERVAAGLPPGLVPGEVSYALDLCRDEAADDPDLLAVIQHEHDLLDLLALSGADFPAPLLRSYTAIAEHSDRRRVYLDLLAGFHRLEGRALAEVSTEVDRLSQILSDDPDLRALGAGTATVDPHNSRKTGTRNAGPTLEQLIPDAAQREVVRRALDALNARS